MYIYIVSENKQTNFFKKYILTTNKPFIIGIERYQNS